MSNKNLNHWYVFMTIICINLCCIAFLQAQKPIHIEKGQRLYIGKDVEYYVDKTSQMGIEDIAKMNFTAGTTDILNLGNVHEEVWLRFSVTSPTEKDIYLEINAPLLNEIEVFEVGDGMVSSIFKGGASIPHSQRPILLENWILNLSVGPAVTKTYYIKGNSIYAFQVPLVLSAKDRFIEEVSYHYLFWGLYIGIMILAFVYNLFIYFSVRERSYLYYLLSILFSSTFYLGFTGFGFWLFWSNAAYLNPLVPVLVACSNTAAILFAWNFLKIDKASKSLYFTGVGLIGLMLLSVTLNIVRFYEIAFPLSQMLSLIVCVYLVILGVNSYRKGVLNAKYFLLAWTQFLILVILYIFTLNNVLPSNFFTTHSAYFGHMMEVALLSFALADRINRLKKENETKQLEIIHSLKTNEALQQNLNRELEIKVKERTSALEETLSHLKDTQTQLIHSEKMASLGELTSSIAHEIQNPLNFVNNFSEVSIELVDELRTELSHIKSQVTDNHPIDLSKMEEADSLLEDLQENQQKINHHGKRADSIVKSMLMHSRNGSGQKEITDINSLCEECLRLSYHGYRSKDKSFDAGYETNFDPNLPKANVVSQDISRVVLNILNNAFYAVNARKAELKDDIQYADYKAKISINTYLKDNKIIVEISDNGTGIPQSIRDKIFQPFFTTKPTGQGTGLGLSLSYDIIKSNGGDIQVQSKEGEGTSFVINLPAI
jgi:signal transduction histidine kinase